MDARRRRYSPEKAHLQVVVQYPTNRKNDSQKFYGFGVTVAANDEPWLLANGETLSVSQIALVERLAGPRPKS
jgi:hypothetical protein